MDEASARVRVLAALGSGLASQDKLAADTGLSEATVGVELTSAEAAGLASRIDIAGETTWRITGAGLLYGVFPDPEPPSVSVISMPQPVAPVSPLWSTPAAPDVAQAAAPATISICLCPND